ncbi:hypothetical protein M513_02600 [Trichuris suis]|uniref:Uncharacterized protein n=1 Tax=Trichuris suis TaxID=68888 RepID=A0A085MH00_9BILA|nr:hypothetical protein M513_02600 [Trichuris suis]
MANFRRARALLFCLRAAKQEVKIPPHPSAKHGARRLLRLCRFSPCGPNGAEEAPVVINFDKKRQIRVTGTDL